MANRVHYIAASEAAWPAGTIFGFLRGPLDRYRWLLRSGWTYQRLVSIDRQIHCH